MRLLFILSLLMLSSCKLKQSSSNLYAKNESTNIRFFLQNEDILYKLDSLIKKEEWHKALLMANQTSLNDINTQAEVIRKKGIIFFKLNQLDSTLACFYQGVLFGHTYDRYAYDSASYIAIWKDFSTNYLKYRNIYLSKTNDSLRNALISINTIDQKVRREKAKYTEEERSLIDKKNKHSFDSLLSINGWIRFSEIGQIKFENNLSLSLIPIHSDEKSNHTYLEMALKAAEKGETNWQIPYDIEQNLFWRFNDNNLIRIRKIYLNKDNKILWDKSIFEIVALASFAQNMGFPIRPYDISDYPKGFPYMQRKLVLMVCRYPGESIESIKPLQTLLRPLRDSCLKYHVDENLIQISDSIPLVQEDMFEKCRFVAKYSRIKL